MKTQRVIQVIEETSNETLAIEMLEGLKLQDNFISGRILEPSASKPNWRAQSFHVDCDTAADFNAWLPDGMKRVLCPLNLLTPCAR